MGNPFMMSGGTVTLSDSPDDQEIVVTGTLMTPAQKLWYDAQQGLNLLVNNNITRSIMSAGRSAYANRFSYDPINRGLIALGFRRAAAGYRGVNRGMSDFTIDTLRGVAALPGQVVRGSLGFVRDPGGTITSGIRALDRAIINDTGFGGRAANAIGRTAGDITSGDPMRIERGAASAAYAAMTIGSVAAPGAGALRATFGRSTVAGSAGRVDAALSSSAAESAVLTGAVHKNSLSYVGDTHVYVIKGSDGSLYKVGESAQGVRIGDGASIRAEQQARALRKETGEIYDTEIRQNFGGKADARAYETKFIQTYERLYGKRPPGNPLNR